MNARRPMVVRCLWGALVVGCGPTLVPVTDPTRRGELHGFSILPPPGDNWYVGYTAAGGRQVIYTKRQAPLASVFVNASSFDLTEFSVTTAEELREGKEQMAEKLRQTEGRVATVRYDAAVDRSPGAECVRYEVVQEERDNTNPALAKLVLEIRTRGFDCLHPYKPGLVVKMLGTGRFPKGSAPVPGETTQREIDAFMQSVTFGRIP
jgi:hypothetical protein